MVDDHSFKGCRDQALAHEAQQAVFEPLGRGQLRVLDIGRVQNLLVVQHRHGVASHQISPGDGIPASAACQCKVC